MSLRPLSPEIMKSFLREEMRKAGYIDFNKMGMWQIADEELIREFADKMNWHAVFHYIQCSKDFIREVLDNYYDYLDWDTIFCICDQNSVDEKFINEYKNKLDWGSISLMHDKISEDFIERHIEEVYWDSISRNPNLSVEFLKRHEDKLRWDCVLYNNKNVPAEMREKHKRDNYMCGDCDK